MNYYCLHESTIYSRIVGKLSNAGCVFAEDEARLLISSTRTLDELGLLVD
ncbi:MAG: hypothetical protein K0Q87_4770, partial [Neobacillus sp.]|nr:hypothetical protein [Neobacillus sp.]